MQKKKKPVLTKKNRIFQSPKTHIFFQTHAFGQKMPIFSLFKFDQNKPRNSAF